MTDRPATETDALTEALVAVQAAMPKVAKTKTANVPMKGGGSYSYTYADLADVTEAILPLLTQHGLAWSCAPRLTPQGYELVGILLHTSGQRVEGALPIHGNDPQRIGSAITYARRYLLGCLTGIVTDDDTDAGPAQGASRTRGWDGPTTAELLTQIDEDATRVGITYEQATASLRKDLPDQSLDYLDSLDPWVVQPFAQKVRAHVEKTLAERAAETSGADQTADTPTT